MRTSFKNINEEIYNVLMLVDNRSRCTGGTTFEKRIKKHFYFSYTFFFCLFLARLLVILSARSGFKSFGWISFSNRLKYMKHAIHQAEWVLCWQQQISRKLKSPSSLFSSCSNDGSLRRFELQRTCNRMQIDSMCHILHIVTNNVFPHLSYCQ